MARAILTARRPALWGRAPFAIVRPHIVIPRAQRLLPCVTRIHGMNTLGTGSAGREWMISRIVFFPTEINLTEYTFVYHNWVTKLDGSTQPEVDNANAMRVYASVERGGVFYPITFDGAAFVDIPAGGTAIGKCPTLVTPTLGQCNVRTISKVNTGETRPVGYSRNSTLSEAAQWSASDQTALLTSGSISNTASGLYYGPSMICAKGTTLPVVGIFGCSIDFSEDETPSLADARGNMGFWQRGLDSTTGGRYAYLNCATQGVRGSGMWQLGTGNRRRFVDAYKAVDQHPFDFIVGFGNENDDNVSLAVWQANTQAWINMAKEQFDCKVFPRTMFPKSTAGANSAFTDTANQTAVSNSAVRQQVNDAIRNGSIKSDGYFDAGAEVSDGTNAQKWKVRAYNNGVLSNGPFTGTSCTLSVAPSLGEALVFGAGVSGFEVSTVTAVTGAGPYTCTLNVSIVTSRANGLVVKAAPNDGDGTHGTTAVYVDIANNRIANNKAQLV